MDIFVAIIFTVEESTGRKRKRDPWQYHVVWEEKETENKKICLKIGTVFLPKRPRKKKEWTKDSLQSYLYTLPVPQEDRYVYYYYEKEAAALLERQNDCLSTEWAFFLLSFYGISFDGLLLFEDPGICIGDWLFSFVRKTRYLGILTKDGERVEETVEQMYEEYGAMLHVYGKVSRCRFPDGCRTLFVVGEENFGLSPADVGENNVLLLMREDLSGSAAGSRIRSERMISIGRFLHRISASNFTSNTRKILYNRGNVV